MTLHVRSSIGTNNLFASDKMHSQQIHIHDEPIPCARFYGAFRFSFPVPEHTGIPSLHIVLYHLRLMGDFRYEGISYREYLKRGQDNTITWFGCRPAKILLSASYGITSSALEQRSRVKKMVCMNKSVHIHHFLFAAKIQY